MGQQQLLLLVLGAIIVGVSVVVGINMFSGSALTANEDAVRQDCLNMASRCIEWYRKPAVLGGGGKDFTNIDFLKIGYDKTITNGVYVELVTGDVIMENENGKYTLNPGTTSMTITGELAEDGYDTDVQYKVEVNTTTKKLTVTKTS